MKQACLRGNNSAAKYSVIESTFRQFLSVHEEKIKAGKNYPQLLLDAQLEQWH